jgi:hypothetical protein
MVSEKEKLDSEPSQFMTKREVADDARKSIATVDDWLATGKLRFTKWAPGKSGGVGIKRSDWETFKKSREVSLTDLVKDPVQSALCELQKLKIDRDRFPVKDYEHYLPKLNGWTVHVSTFIGGDFSWYEQRNSIAGIKKYLGQIESARGLFGRVEAAVVKEILETLKNKIIVLLGSNPLGGNVVKNIYPTLANDLPLYVIQNGLHLGCFIEMNHSFFNLADDQQLEVKNTSKKDILYSSELFGKKNDNRFRYRIPAEGAWISIPSFEPDTRPDSATPGYFASARELFNRRKELQIRVVKKTSSRLPMCMADELEKNIVAEADKTAEIAALIKIVQNGG